MSVEMDEFFNDRILTSDMIGSYTLDTMTMCAARCTSQASCVSFFYNKHTLACQTHSLVFTDPTSSLVSINTFYYHITHGNSIIEPIKELESCEDVKTCSSVNVDATYLLYPPVLGGHGVQIYCHNLATDPKAYVTLFEENKSRSDYSLRTGTYPCRFDDRDGDATARFHKISVNLTDMSVNRADFTFAGTCQETHRPIPKFGEAAACSFKYTGGDYDQCPAPGVFIINTNGTGLKVRPDCTWSEAWSYAARVEPVVWSLGGLKIESSIDGWCSFFNPERIHLEYSSLSDIRGTPTTAICSSD